MWSLELKPHVLFILALQNSHDFSTECGPEEVREALAELAVKNGLMAGAESAITEWERVA